MANLILKAAIIRRFGSQLHFAKAVGIGELRVSKIIHNRAHATPEEVQAIARMLELPPGEIFPKESAA